MTTTSIVLSHEATGLHQVLFNHGVLRSQCGASVEISFAIGATVVDRLLRDHSPPLVDRGLLAL